jgi:hypothetical protein
VSAVIAAAPEDGIGVILLANADDKQSAMTDIALRVANKAFGLGTGNSSYTPSNDPSTGVTSPADSAAPVNYPDPAGTYFNAGYGTAVLCSVHSSSSACQVVLDDFRAVDKSLSQNSTDLFSSWITPWTSHIRFTHTNDSQYIISGGTIYPEGYGKNSTPFSTLSPGPLATFVVENESVIGFGITGISGVKREGSVEEASDVWFVRQA